MDLKQCIKDRLALLLREEEIKWLQRAKTKELLEGDNNTKYFQLVANGKRRKTRILRLEQEEGVIEGEENLKSYITNYYRKLFDKSKQSNFLLEETLISDILQVSEEENNVMLEEFT